VGLEETMEQSAGKLMVGKLLGMQNVTRLVTEAPTGLYQLGKNKNLVSERATLLRKDSSFIFNEF
jgi:hypothetical protein